MKKININTVLSHEDFEKIEAILSENGIETFVIPSNEGVTNTMISNEENIILITDGDNVILEKRDGFYNAHFLSTVNLFRLIGEMKITEKISLRNPSTEVEEGFMGELGENIIGEVFFNDEKILEVRISGGSDIQQVVRSAILNRHFELHPELVSGLSNDEVFELRQSLDLHSIAETMIEEDEDAEEFEWEVQK